MLPFPFHKFPSSTYELNEYGRGAHIFHQESASDAIFYLHRGRVDLQRYTETGQGVIVHSAYSGEYFAEASLFSEFYHCDAICLTETLVAKIPKKEVLETLQSDDEFMRAYCQNLSQLVQSYRLKLQILAIPTAKERILAAMRAGIKVDQVSQFAMSIGLSRETVYRSLSELARDKVVGKVARGRYVLYKQAQ